MIKIAFVLYVVILASIAILFGLVLAVLIAGAIAGVAATH